LTRMLAQALLHPLDARQDARVLCYPVWSAVPANLACDITGVVGLQERALLRYTTAMKVDDYVHFCQDRNYYEAVTVAGRAGFVEGFFATPAREFPGLTSSMEGSDG